MADATTLRTRLFEHATRVHSRAVDDTQRAVSTAAPFRTGATRRGVQRTPTQRIGNRLSAQVENTTPQGEWGEYGTRPHIIKPKTAKALRFKVRGRMVYARVVHHPGTPPRPWLRPTARQHWPAALRRAAATN